MGRVIRSSSIQSSPLTHDPSELTPHSKQVTTVIIRFENKWRYEDLVNLSTNIVPTKSTIHIINGVVLVHSDKTPRSMWKMEVVT